MIPSPGQSLIEAFDLWAGWAEQSHADYAFHTAITWWSDQVAEEMGVLARERGVQSFKHFLAYKGSLMLDDEALFNSFTRAKELGALCTTHAENGEMVARGQKAMLDAGITGPEAHPWSRPVECEAESTSRVIRAAQNINTPVCVVHVSCEEAMNEVAAAKARGQVVYAEVLAGHATIDDSVYFQEDEVRARAHIMSPPFRPAGNPEALRKALVSGVADTTATDNCTFCSYGGENEGKNLGTENALLTPNGCGHVEFRMPVLLDELVLSEGEIKMDLPRFVAVSSTNAAKIFNMYPQKGVIQVGSDADIAVFNPNAKMTLSAETHFQAVDVNIWEGREINCVPMYTIMGGKVCWRAKVVDGVADWQGGEYTGSVGQGKYIPRPLHGHAFETHAQREASRKKVPIDRS